MVIIEGTDKSQRGERERFIAPQASKAILSPKIINFEEGRKALEKRGRQGRIYMGQIHSYTWESKRQRDRGRCLRPVPLISAGRRIGQTS